jgi:hypothetical protein
MRTVDTAFVFRWNRFGFRWSLSMQPDLYGKFERIQKKLQDDGDHLPQGAEPHPRTEVNYIVRCYSYFYKRIGETS